MHRTIMAISKNGDRLNILDGQGVSTAVMTARTLLDLGIIKEGTDVVTPITEEIGESKEFYRDYEKIIDAMADLSRD
jgi:F0F1-type ATP synthase beta subunit